MSTLFVADNFSFLSSFLQEQYAELCQNIEDASHKPVPCDLTGDLAVFANIERGNHPTIIKVNLFMFFFFCKYLINAFLPNPSPDKRLCICESCCKTLTFSLWTNHEEHDCHL